MNDRVLVIDTSFGVAGDMLLAALLDVGADEEVVRREVAAVLGDEVTLERTEVVRAGIRANRIRVVGSGGHPERHEAAIRDLLRAADEPVRRRAADVFEVLVTAEARVHGVPREQVHLHEVGAWDSIADVVGCVAAIHSLDAAAVTCQVVGLGSGTVESQHGVMPVPPPAVVEVLSATGATTVPGPARFEAATPTGAAVLAASVTRWGPPGAHRPVRQGFGAGSADPEGHANVVRVILGESMPESQGVPPADPASLSAPPSEVPHSGGGPVVMETNIDDLDPRAWPHVLAALLDAGASDAWLTPIHMKKGRPAHTLSVLCAGRDHRAIAGIVMAHTTSLGLRVRSVGKIRARRRFDHVEVGGQRIAIKVGEWGGAVVNVQPEWRDVVAASEALDLPPKQVLARATAAAVHLWD